MVRHIAGTARPYIYTTAMPAAQASATLAAVKLARREQWRRDKLQESIAHFRAGAQRRGLPLLESETPIQPLLVGDDRAALAMSQALEARGFWVAAIRPPTVPEGTARLRITLTTGHDRLQLDALLHALDEARGQVQALAATAPA